MRLLSGMGFVTEVSEKTYLSNSTTRAMSAPPVAASLIHLYVSP